MLTNKWSILWLHFQNQPQFILTRENVLYFYMRQDIRITLASLYPKIRVRGKGATRCGLKPGIQTTIELRAEIKPLAGKLRNCGLGVAFLGFTRRLPRFCACLVGRGQYTGFIGMCAHSLRTSRRFTGIVNAILDAWVQELKFFLKWDLSKTISACGQFFSITALYCPVQSIHTARIPAFSPSSSMSKNPRTHAFLLLAFGHIQRIAKFTKHDRGKAERRPKKFFINQ